MSLLDTASLLLTPNAYKEGKLYSVIPSDGSGDFTFTRATTATRVNSDGLVELVPYNLLTYSEQFNNAAWTVTLTSITANSETAPDGTLTADTLTANGSFGLHALPQAGNSINGTTYTHSIYAKKNTNDFIQLFGTGSIYTNLTTFANFDLNLGVVGLVGAGTTASIQDIGNGWYRCTMTATATATTTGNFIAPCLVTSATSSRAESNNLTTSVFIWGAQLVEGTNALPYQKTETRLNIPRLDYSLGGCPSILLEPQRTNLALQSSSFSNAYWTKSNSSVTSGFISPDGTLNAFKLVGNAATGVSNINGSFTSLAANYSSSFYVKPSGKQFIQILWSSGQSTEYSNFDLINGIVTQGDGKISNIGNGWFRISLTTSLSAAAGQTFLWNIDSGTSTRAASSTGDGTSGIYIYGAQVELGSYATSYIPTTTASVTRNQDVCVKTGISSLIGQTEGTLYAEVNITTFNNGVFFSINDGTSANRIQMYKFTDNKIYCDRISATQSGTTSISSSALSVGTYKIAFAYQSGSSALFINGTQVGATSAATFTFGSMGKVNIGSRFDELSAQIFNDRIELATLFQTRLTNAQLATLTTL